MKTDKTPIEIVMISPTEWQAYRELRLEALRDSPQAYCSFINEQQAKPDEFWQARLEEAARGENNWLLFARFGQSLVGMVGAFRIKTDNDQEDGRTAEVVSVYVTPSMRGRGISKLLMNAILKLLQENGIRVARLGVNAQQEAALNLYQQLGFSTVRIKPLLMGDGLVHDETIMENILEKASG